MTEIHSKSLLLYSQVRRSLQSGRYVPGERIDPASLADEFDTSQMPARLALYRLVGRGLLDHHVRGGVYVPLPTEVALRERYDWMQRLLDVACDIGPATFRRDVRPIDMEAGDDTIKLTWQLFDAMARITGHASLHDEVKRSNDWLAPIRRGKHHLIEDADAELAHLVRQWHRCDLPRLRAALGDYHERRRRLVPCIVATLRDQADGLG